jgi:hypothetical protein
LYSLIKDNFFEEKTEEKKVFYGWWSKKILAMQKHCQDLEKLEERLIKKLF